MGKFCEEDCHKALKRQREFPAEGMHFLADFREGGGVFAGFEGAVQEVGDVRHFLLLQAALAVLCTAEGMWGQLGCAASCTSTRVIIGTER